MRLSSSRIEISLLGEELSVSSEKDIEVVFVRISEIVFLFFAYG